jgi:hypothetical protein
VNKLARLVRYHQFKDLKPRLASATKDAGTEDFDTGLVAHDGANDGAIVVPGASTPAGNDQSKRVKICYQFLKELDAPSGKLTAIFRDDFHPDPITAARNRRLAELTNHMSVKEYIYFQVCVNPRSRNESDSFLFHFLVMSKCIIRRSNELSRRGGSSAFAEISRMATPT